MKAEDISPEKYTTERGEYPKALNHIGLLTTSFKENIRNLGKPGKAGYAFPKGLIKEKKKQSLHPIAIALNPAI